MHAKNGGATVMKFEEFEAWLSNRLKTEREFQTLKARSHFYARYDSHNRAITVRLRTGYQGQLREDHIRRVFERYQNGSQSERNMTSFYYDPWWPETPNRILAPAVPAMIKVWIEERA